MQYERIVESLSIDNTIWADTVIASGTVIGLVCYTGRETRAAMNASVPKSKIGLLDNEINFLSKVTSLLHRTQVPTHVLHQLASLLYSRFPGCSTCHIEGSAWPVVYLHVPLCAVILVDHSNQSACQS